MVNRKRSKGESYELYRANLKIESEALQKKLNGGVIWNFTEDTPFFGSMKERKGATRIL